MDLSEFREIGRIRSKSPQYAKKRAEALQASADLLLSHKRPYLSLSGGKDSVAMAFLVDEAARSVNRDFEVWCHLSDASFPGTRETVEDVCRRIGRKLVIYESPVSAYDLAERKEKRAFGKSGVFFGSIREYAADKDLAFVGVRAFESKRRMKAAKVHGMVFQSESMGNVTVCHPLLWFRLADVAALLYEYNAPLHPIYAKMALGGRNKFGEESWIRLGYITSKDLLNKGTAVFLKLNYPELYNKLARAYPEIGRYT
jgi:3'-phosphoadenosine 5'-phosphosulfate sulfotransferase (PAPS reductase)/FAD synthetase